MVPPGSHCLEPGKDPPTKRQSSARESAEASFSDRLQVWELEVAAVKAETVENREVQIE